MQGNNANFKFEVLIRACEPHYISALRGEMHMVISVLASVHMHMVDIKLQCCDSY